MLQSLTREKFWIIKEEKTIKNEISNYTICKRLKAKSLSSEPTPLLLDHVTGSSVFQIIGIDLTGPLFSKAGDKICISLFTCVVYCTVKLESGSSLVAFLQTSPDVGGPLFIYCDNGTKIRSTFNEPLQIYWDKILGKAMISKISWIYTIHFSLGGGIFLFTKELLMRA